MLDIKFIRENSDIVKKACQLKNITLDIDLLLTFDRELVGFKTEEQSLLTQKNALTSKIPKASAEERPK
jgi:seryl-tRNA synthetase